jgi:hypothetical protein
MFFEKQNTLGSDDCWIQSQNTQSKEMYNYHMFNPYKTNIPKCEKKLEELQEFVVENNMHIRDGYGFTSACLVDNDTNLRNKQAITHGKCKNQLNTRLFQAVPDLGNGVFHPILESRLTQGELTGEKKSCEVTTGKGFDVFTPMLPCLKETIQDVKHIVPQWVRGGEHTRDHIKQKSFLERNGYVFEENAWKKKNCN